MHIPALLLLVSCLLAAAYSMDSQTGAFRNAVHALPSPLPLAGPATELQKALERAALAESRLAALQAAHEKEEGDGGVAGRVESGCSNGGSGSGAGRDSSGVGRSGWPAPRSDGFSSFECTAGSQVFTRGYDLQRTQAPYYPKADDPMLRICLLRDVCFSQEGELQYYANPELEKRAPPHLSMAAFAGGTLVQLDYLMAQFGGAFRNTSIRYDGSFVPTVVVGQRPPHLPFFSASTATVHALGRLSFANNWGHLLVDTILPHLAAADIFGFDDADLQLLDLYSCDTMYNAHYPLESPPGMVHRDLCEINTERWLGPLFSHPMLSAPTFHGQCFHQLLVGHGGALSLKSLWHHRAATIRKARARLHRVLGVAEPPISRHHIVVFVKTLQSNGSDLPGLCEAVKSAALALRQPIVPQGGLEPIKVECVEPAPLSAQEQLSLVSQATLTVCENGSTGYLALFQRPGTTFLSVLGEHEEMGKEPQVLLSLTDVQVFYSSWSDLREFGTGQLLLGLERAGIRLGLPQVATAA